MTRPDSPSFSSATLAELSALADGSLDPARREEVRARIERSPELQALYERERLAVEALHGARTERAPAALRARIEAQRPRATPRRRRRIGFGAGLTGALTAAAVAIALVLSAGGAASPSLSQAAALSARAAVNPAPGPDSDEPNRLDVTLGSVYFPNWRERFGWRAVGERRDRLGGRLAITVFYARRGARLAYTIVDAPALAVPASTVSWRRGVRLSTLRLSGRRIVTWRRADHTCVLSGNAPVAELQQLASWNE